ncbi:NAD(P)/FAD-dependent oxidoreductase [Pseudorhodobacter sp.]|uniref:FAD-dependent oxidoreductase n=1 Tax=Pseudorhodobacter sp. TaxID=1934400 RepID=UPI00264726E8|nr:FAD-dependent monooxygenase [Pseudorhodobacter sp.]MDN5786563.1 FAD-dependent monooxygenase [Pseudorhodobacter sp.]
MRVAIAGAGIGGLAVAALLAKAGLEVALYDQFDAPRAVGSGLVIQPVGLAVLDLCDAGAEARAMGQHIARMLGREVTRGRRVLDVSYDREGRKELQGLTIHRAALHGALLAAAGRLGVAVVPSSLVAAAPMAGAKRKLQMADGRVEGPFDLVIDASGAGSALSPLRARPLPYGAIWGTVPWPDATTLPADQLSQRYFKARHMIGVMPLGQVPGRIGPQAALFWSMRRDELAQWPSRDATEWKQQAATLWPEMHPFLAEIVTTAQMTPASYTHGNLRRPYADRLAFIGDAAHRASPQLGQGANMALLDALALSLALQRGPLEQALATCARMRRWHVRIYQGMSAAFTPQYQSDSRVLPALRDWALAPLSLTWPLPRILSRLVAGELIPPLAGEAFPTRAFHLGLNT